MLLFGYKPTGEACLFDLSAGETLPAGWSRDVLVITDDAKRTSEAITAAAGGSILTPVKPAPEVTPIPPAPVKGKT